MDEYNLGLMDLIDRHYLKTPFYGSRRMSAYLSQSGYKVNRKRVQRLMRLMGIQAIYPGPNLSKRRQEHKIYPYLLRGVIVDRPDFVWSTDITYVRVKGGFIYLMAVTLSTGSGWFPFYTNAKKPDNNGINTVINTGKKITGDCNLKKTKNSLDMGSTSF